MENCIKNCLKTVKEFKGKDMMAKGISGKSIYGTAWNDPNIKESKI